MTETEKLTVEALVEKAHSHLDTAQKCFVAAAQVWEKSAAVMSPHQPLFGELCKEAALLYLRADLPNVAKRLATDGQFKHDDIGPTKEDLETLRKIEKAAAATDFSQIAAFLAEYKK